MSSHSSLNNNPFSDGVSVIWNGLLFGLAGRLRHPGAAVAGEELWRGINLYYHGLGGTLENRLDSQGFGSSRGLILKTHGGVDLQAWLEPGRIHLPRRINRFPTRDLNRELYFWLAVYLAQDEPLPGNLSMPHGLRHLLQGLATSHRVLNSFPNLRHRYQRLCESELSQRKNAISTDKLKSGNLSHLLENEIRIALGDRSAVQNSELSELIHLSIDGKPIEVPQAWKNKAIPFLPVPLWAYRNPESSGIRVRWFKSSRRPRSDGDVTPQQQPIFEPEYMSQPRPDFRAIPDENVYPEWDCFSGSYKTNWCRVVEQEPKGGYRAELDPSFNELVRRVHKRFVLLRQESYWNRHLEFADHLDIDGFVAAYGDAKGCGIRRSDFYREKIQRWRDMSVLLLLDASRSTEAWVGSSRAIDVAKQSMAVLAQVFLAASDNFALYSFSSDSRLRVRCDRIKEFGDAYDERVQRNILEVKPSNYTRMGAAVRHTGKKLLQCQSRQKLLIVMSDGRPHDPTDRYEGKYALEDTRKALNEMRSRNVQCFGLTIDQQGSNYLRYLFGPGHYAVYSHLQSLPEILPRLYVRITDMTR